jgi:hypothetical protein
MRSKWHRSLAWLTVIALLGITFSLCQAGPLGDYTWGVYGGSRESSRLGREELISRGNYCPTGGCLLRLDGVEVKPGRARKGETLVLGATYTILTPEQVALPVTISREITFQGKSLGRTKDMETRKLNGTWNQEISFSLPTDAAPGEYTLKTRVTTGYSMEEKSIQFTVN